VIRRCNDLLPQLVRLAAVEMRHRARGTSDRLDVRAALSVSRALAALSVPGPMGLSEQRLVTEPMGPPEHLPLPEGLNVSDPRLVPEHRPVPEGLTVPVPGQRSVPAPQPAPEAA